MNRDQMVDSIETPRLVLFPYTADNLALFNADLAAFERLFGVVYQGEELDYLLREFLQRLQGQVAADPANYLFFTEFLLVRKADDRILGSIDFKYIPREGVTEVGYGLNPRHEGQGYMTEALQAFLAFGQSMGVRTVLAETVRDNIKSQNVLRRCGFTLLREEDNLWWQRRL